MGEKNNSVKYLLYSAVIHSGRSAEFGHYYTIGRHVKKSLKAYNENGEIDNGIWYMFNDRNVSMSTYDKLCKVSHYYRTDVPYLLFYRRIDNKNEELVKKEQESMNKDDIEIISDNNDNNIIKDDNENKEDDMDIVDESEWEKKVEEDNKIFEKELVRFAAQKSPPA